MFARFAATVGVVLLQFGAASAEVVTEMITFVSEDGKSYLEYQGNRTDYSNYTIHREKGGTLDDHLYFFPNSFTWDRKSNPEKDLLKIQQGDYSFIKNNKFGDSLDFIYQSAKDQDPESKYYGIWNQPSNIGKLVYAWVMPANLEIVDAISNREGEWVRRNNTITWFGSDVNNVSFTIRYRAKTAGTYNALNEVVGSDEGVTLDQAADGVRLTLADTILFPSGSAELSDNGKAVIAKLAGAIDFSSGLNAVVEGHTDNVPIKGALQLSFASNWELAAARSLAVVRAFEGKGAPGAQLEARAYGEHRPVADNATNEGRMANRRISVLISSGK